MGKYDNVQFPINIPEYQHTFTSKEELEDYERRLAERNMNLAAWQKNFDVTHEELQPGQVDIRTFTIEDLKFFNLFQAELTNYVGPRKYRQGFNNWIDHSTEPIYDPIPVTANVGDKIAFKNSVGYDWSTYSGPLLQVLMNHRSRG